MEEVGRKSTGNAHSKGAIIMTVPGWIVPLKVIATKCVKIINAKFGWVGVIIEKTIPFDIYSLKKTTRINEIRLKWKWQETEHGKWLEKLKDQTVPKIFKMLNFIGSSLVKEWNNLFWKCF